MLQLKKYLRGLLRFNIIELSGGTISESSVISNSNLSGTISIGSNTNISNSNIRGQVYVGNDCQLLNSSLSGKVMVNDFVRLIDGVNINGEVIIGKNTSISGPNTDLTCLVNKIEIGNFCSIARNVTFQEFNHDFNRLTSYFIHRNLMKDGVRKDVISKGSIKLGHDVWVGTHSVILSGVNIGTGAVVAANSVVTQDIPPYAIFAGSPAKMVKYRFEREVIDELLASQWWTLGHEEIIEMYKAFNLRTQ